MRCQCITCIGLIYVPVSTGGWARNNGRPNGYFACHGAPRFNASYQWNRLHRLHYSDGAHWVGRWREECDYYWPGESISARAYFDGTLRSLEVFLALGNLALNHRNKIVERESWMARIGG